MARLFPHQQYACRRTAAARRQQVDVAGNGLRSRSVDATVADESRHEDVEPQSEGAARRGPALRRPRSGPHRDAGTRIRKPVNRKPLVCVMALMFLQGPQPPLAENVYLNV